MIQLFLLFTVLPAVDLWLLVKLGGWMGAWNAVLFAIGMGMVGAWLARREGVSVLRQLAEDTSRGLPPGSRIVEGLMVLAGAVLLITPGVITDAMGLLLLFPPTRRLLAPLVLAWMARRATVAGWNVQVGPGIRYGAGDPPPTSTPTPPDGRRPPFDHPVA